ncbi:MAG: nickel-responsive transcriptional regulator NikR [Brachymonas sp.]|nr:nickel-responsive transcriptional regulator NikR [Brachymonas sp.]
MERITISLDKVLIKEFDELIQHNGYQNRSEAMRDLLRAKIQELRLQRHQAPFCLANISYIYQHRQRDLTERLLEMQHLAHDIVMVNSHIHLDYKHCMENVILKGKTEQVQHVANKIIAERGVRYGNICIMPSPPDLGGKP